MLAGAAFIALIGGITVATPRKAHSASPYEDTDRVLVVNKPDRAVPTSAQGTTTVGGTVNVGSMPAITLSGPTSVDAKQSGPWTVGFDPAQNVVQDSAVAGKLDTANTHLGNIAAAAGQLSFDGGNLKTVPQGTQNVNVVGGAI